MVQRSYGSFETMAAVDCNQVTLALATPTALGGDVGVAAADKKVYPADVAGGNAASGMVYSSPAVAAPWSWYSRL